MSIVREYGLKARNDWETYRLEKTKETWKLLANWDPELKFGPERGQLEILEKGLKIG